MKYSFEKFERDYSRGEAQISVTKAPAIRFSAKFCKVTSILAFEYVTLFYDKINNAIGILPTHKQEKSSFKITKDNSSAAVSIASFMSTYSLDPEIYHGRYQWTKEIAPNIGEMYVIALKEQK